MIGAGLAFPALFKSQRSESKRVLWPEPAAGHETLMSVSHTRCASLCCRAADATLTPQAASQMSAARLATVTRAQGCSSPVHGPAMCSATCSALRSAHVHVHQFYHCTLAAGKHDTLVRASGCAAASDHATAWGHLLTFTSVSSVRSCRRAATRNMSACRSNRR